MKPFIPTLIAFLTLASAAGAATLRGLVVNTALGQPEPYATVRVWAAADSTHASAMTTTDDTGNFTVDIASAGSYRVTVNATGLSSSTSILEVESDGAVIDLGTINLDPATELAEVTVSAQRPVVKREIDRLNYDVQADDEARTATILDILRKVPMVTVDPQGDIRIKGSSGFKIYKNGRYNKAFSQNPKEIFTAIPASTIKRIEVITDPGAREDAEGTGVILNIVTMDDTAIYGIMGNLSLSSDTDDDFLPSPSLFLTGQAGKFTISAYGGFRHIGPWNNRSSEHAEGSYASTGNSLVRDVKSTRRSTYGWSGLEASFEPDTLNLFTVELGVYPSAGHSDTESSVSLIRNDGSTVYSYTDLTHSPLDRNLWISGAVNYQRSTRRKDESITLSYQISGSSSHNRSMSAYTDMVSMPVDYTGTYSDSRTRFLEQTVQIDWFRPLSKVFKLDVGGKYIHRRSHALTQQEYIGAYADNDDFIHLTQVGAVYADLRASYGRMSYRAGLRYEYSRLSADYPDGTGEGFASNLNDFVPNAAVSVNMSESQNLKFSYGMTIQRPGISTLNPAVYKTPYTVSFGNPHLKSALYNNLNLEYSLTLQHLYLEASAGYTFLNNAVATVRSVTDDITTFTYANIDHQRQASLSLYTQWTPFDGTQLSGSMTAGYGRCASESLNLSLSRWNYWVNLNLSQKLPWNLKGRIGMNYGSGWLNDVYRYTRAIDGAQWSWNVSLQRSFLRDDRLDVSIYWVRPFGSMSTVMRTYSVNSDYTGYSDRRDYRNSFAGIRLSWRFGSLNASVKKTARSIVNDDLQGGSRQGGGK